jgi:pyruvate/2-oxoglutarate dehydrogenase complex dihydrolipoamide dehydrogenase (E3) component
MTHVEALDLERLPEHLVVLGGGFVALELAQAFRRFGSRVTMLVRDPQLARREDLDEGIDVKLNTDLLEVQGESGQELRLRVRDQEGEWGIVASDILVATGRVAFDDFRIVRDNLNGGDRSTQGRIVPFCLFTDPELARVGWSETAARNAASPTG